MLRRALVGAVVGLGIPAALVALVLTSVAAAEAGFVYLIIWFVLTCSFVGSFVFSFGGGDSPYAYRPPVPRILIRPSE